MLLAIVLVENFSERILPDHHVEVGGAELLPQVKDDGESQVSVATGQSFAEGAWFLLKLDSIQLV